jgi:hypothetical protein
MDVTVTRKVRLLIDDKRRVSIINNRTSQGGDSTVVNILKSAEIKETVEQIAFGFCFLFKTLRRFEYTCQEDLVISEQLAQNSNAELTYMFDGEEIPYVYGNLLSQYDLLIITPTTTGMITLLGELKL